MLNLYDCIANAHDLRMVALAALICALGAYATFALGAHARAMPRGPTQARWLALTVLTSACSIWATHFIAMLAYRAPIPAGFLLAPTVLSFFVAVLMVTAAGRIGLRARGRRAAILSGVALGLAISAMHYCGMSGFRVLGDVTWDGATVAVSVALGIGFSIAAVVSAGSRKRPHVFLPAVFFLLAVCSDHFVAMSAATVSYNPAVRLPDGLIEGKGLALGIGAIALLILGSALVAQALYGRARRRLTDERDRLKDFAEFSVEGLVLCDGDTIVWANRSIRTLLPDDGRDCVGRSLSLLLPPDVVARLSEVAEIDAILGAGPAATPVRVISKTIQLEHRPHRVVAFRDQRERLTAEAEMRRLATSDPLTGLANRARFNETMEQLLASRRTEERAFALLSLDLDRFKHVNDAHGHAAGDALLVRVARRLEAIVRGGGLVARIGGDEFSVIATGTGGPDGARAMADRIVEILSRPFVIEGNVHEIGASVGVALTPHDGLTTATLVRAADLALYRAKEDGGGTCRLFETAMDARMQERRQLESALRRAVARQEFVLFYQPLVDAVTGLHVGAEALIRWNHPERGLLGPDQFIGVAEDTNLIGGIGEWVLHEACSKAALWPAHLCVAVNLSPVQFRDPQLCSIVASALEESGLPGNRLEVEITESVLIDDDIGVLTTLQTLRQLGVRIALDDFGTGYSSLGHLRRFPFDKIKIDRSFVSNAPDDRDSAAIVRAVVSLGATLGLQTTAEGVETEAQRRFVADEGCDQIQGYFFNRPTPVAGLPAAFRAPSRNEPCQSRDFSIAATAS